MEFAIDAAGRPALLHLGTAGELVLSRPDGGGTWQPDTLAPSQGALLGWSLVIDASTGDPVVAWSALSGGVYRIGIARRTPSAWTTVQVDSSTDVMTRPALAFDALGRPRLAVLRSAGPQSGVAGLWYAEADELAGPWTWTLADDQVDAGGNAHAALALDASTGEPRVAYASFLLFYASRTGGVWTTQPFGLEENWNMPPSLALDAAGRPRVLACGNSAILAGSTPPAAAEACGGVSTYSVWFLERDSATGTDPFQATYMGRDRQSQAHGLAMASGRVDLVWRDTNFSSCVPADIVHAERVDPVGVAPGGGVAVRGLDLQPMPVRRGGTVSLTLRLAASARVTCLVHDVAGRCVSRRTVNAAAGVTVTGWDLRDLRPGVYRVSAWTPGGRIGSRALVVR
jgi:hypothetical protein